MSFTTNLLCTLTCVFALAAASAAQVTPIGPFVGAALPDGATEDGETLPYQSVAPCVAPRLFQNRADLCSPGASGCYVSSGWGFSCSLSPASGSVFFGNTANTTEIRLDQPARSFGAWFACNSGTPDGIVRLYDSQDQLLGTQPYLAPASCTWTWNGWTAEGEAIRRIEIQSNFSGGGFVMLDDLQVDFDVNGLIATPPSLSVSAGGTQAFIIVAGAANAGLPYLLLGSLSGSTPGTPVDGKTLPLNVDGYTFHTLLTPNTPPLAGSFGTLDATGRAAATFDLPAGASAGLVGLTATHAFVVVRLEPTLLSLPYISNAATLDFTL